RPVRLTPPLATLALGLTLALPVPAQTPATPVQASDTGDPAAIERKEQGNRVTENIPEIPAELIERLNRYQNTRGASVSGWTKQGCLLVSTRFAETSQVHRVCEPLGMREQLTFHPEPVAGVTVSP